METQYDFCELVTEFLNIIVAYWLYAETAEPQRPRDARNVRLKMFKWSSEFEKGLSSVGLATGWTAGDRFTAGTSDFSLLHSVWTDSGSHPASRPMGTSVLAPGVKRTGH
jgi:hypothetical protein